MNNKIYSPRFAQCSLGDKVLPPKTVSMIPHQTVKGEHADTHLEAVVQRKERGTGNNGTQGSDSRGNDFYPRELWRSSDMVHL